MSIEPAELPRGAAEPSALETFSAHLSQDPEQPDLAGRWGWTLQLA